MSSSVTPWTTARQASLCITNSQSLLKLMSTESLMSSNHLILCHPLPLPPLIIPNKRIFSNKLVICIRCKVLEIGGSASASVLPKNIQDWFPLGLTSWISLQTKGLSRVLQHYSSKASILLGSAFFIVQLSHPCMTTGKTIALTRQTFVGKVICFLITFTAFLICCIGLS